MPIVSSSVQSMNRQIDGRVQVVEQHLDSLGVNHLFLYLAPAGTTAAQAATTCTNRDAGISADMKAQEIANNIAAVSTLGKFAVITLNDSTALQNAAALRVAYKDMTQAQAILTGEYLSTLSDGALQTAFSLTAGQVTSLRTNTLTPAANTAATIRAATGV